LPDEEAISVKRRTVVILLVLAVLAGGAYWVLRARDREKPLEFAGTIEARDAEVGSLVGGRVSSVLVSEGDIVKTGQPLVTFETDLGALQIREQRAVVDQARANLAKVQAGPRREEIARAKAQVENAAREERRLKNLLGQGLIPRQQYDDAATAAKTADETYRELARGSRVEDVHAAEGALDEAEQKLAYLLRQSQETVVKAPADGVIESLDLRPGDLVPANQPVARILEPGQLWVRVWVPEPLLGRVRLGEAGTIQVDTFPKREFHGKVVEIRQQGEYTPRNVQTLKQRMDLVFGVKVAIDPTPELKPGMAATVRLVDGDR
jgi:membrane fusion protein YbhG